ncbi:hypothetical protein NE865_06822 [Phthorimaea operculella]|nr:hypothetical protein NE865_06822 [Phthorimaea operculella]
MDRKIDSPTEKLKTAKAEGLLSPLEGKTPAEKEKYLRRLAKAGIPLPEGKTATDKKLIGKVRQELDLSSKPKTPSKTEEELKKKAAEAGLLTPLEGKTPAQKEKILRGLAKAGLPLPEGKTASEKKLIQKVRQEIGVPPQPKTEPKSPSEQAKLAKSFLEAKSPSKKEQALIKMAEAGVPLPEGRTLSEKALVEKVKPKVGVPDQGLSEKLQKAKDEGLMTPLTGKSQAQQEKILRGLAKAGIPLPEGKTDSQKKVINKVRMELGLPPEPKTSSEKAKLAKAYAKGYITPLEGKSPSKKEQALRKMYESGISLPKGRTPSEKQIIEKIKREPPVVKPPSEKLRQAKAEGFLTPLSGKPPEEKKRILKGLAKIGLPLPEGKTESEKKVIDKVRKEMGLPPGPKTPSERVKIAKFYAAGAVTPLEGKTPSQKEQALTKMAKAGVPLPEGRTASEKALIVKVKTKLPSPERKARPPLPPQERAKLDKETAKNIQEAKGPVNECICDLLTPESDRRKSSIKEIPSEKIRKAKAEGLLTPLSGKSPAEQEKILRGLAKAGIPLPEGKTASQKNQIDKIRKEMGLPPGPRTSSEKAKIEKAYATGAITPLEGKTTQQKEQALKKMAEAGVLLPEGRTSSEKALIDKVKKEIGPPSPELPGVLPSEKIRKAKAAGLLTPLTGKTPKQKEKILKGLVKAGIPLPEGKTASEKKIIEKVRQEMGLPTETASKKEQIQKRLAEAGVNLPEGRTPSEKALIAKVKKSLEPDLPPGIPSKKIRQARAEGLFTPLAGKTPAEKERILKRLAELGIRLPKGITPSEKKMIDKIRYDLGLPPEPKTASERDKMDKLYAAGIITPLATKTNSKKEIALKKMADAGIPLPEGRTPSEKALIEAVKKALAEKMRKAKTEGLLTPLEGKTPEQKEKILRGLAKAGIPLPDGKNASEKKLVSKIRHEMEAKTSSEKGRPASERALVSKGKKTKAPRPSKTVGDTGGPGITEEVMEIQKTTKCDRACGCDKKKIRFKHSYIKIRVTSPDISSFCPCPDECVPGVKGGVFVDNEGIKVTVGRVSGQSCIPTLANSQMKSIKPFLEYESVRSLSATSLSQVSVYSITLGTDNSETSNRYHENSLEMYDSVTSFDSYKECSNAESNNYDSIHNYVRSGTHNIYDVHSGNVIDEPCLEIDSVTSILILLTESSSLLSTNSYLSDVGAFSVSCSSNCTIPSRTSTSSEKLNVLFKRDLSNEIVQ